MIPFFRKIRYGLSSDGKFFKYLRYAIGEIFLVVIGILIALQINNWNEHQKEVRKSRGYLKEFRKDLVRDTLSFNQGLQILGKEMNEELWALGKVDYELTDADSILLAKNTVYFARKIITRTFNNVQNSGNSNLVGYDSLFVTISDYYTTTNELVEAMAQWEVSTVAINEPYKNRFKEEIEYTNAFFRRSRDAQDPFDFPMVSDPEDQAEKLVSFATSVAGRNHFKENYRRHLALERSFHYTIQEAKDLIEEIDQALD